MSSQRPLWTCPRCGHRFVNRNNWHSCTRYSLDHHFAERDPRLRVLYRAFLSFVRENGPVTVIPQKTRIAFMVRVRFAGVVVRRNWIECGVWLKRRVEDPRFHRIETYTPRDYGHFFRLTEASQLEGTMRKWIREAYAIGCPTPQA